MKVSPDPVGVHRIRLTAPKLDHYTMRGALRRAARPAPFYGGASGRRTRRAGVGDLGYRMRERWAGAVALSRRCRSGFTPDTPVKPSGVKPDLRKRGTRARVGALGCIPESR